jgi:hypothetical protein
LKLWGRHSQTLQLAGTLIGQVTMQMETPLTLLARLILGYYDKGAAMAGLAAILAACPDQLQISSPREE